MKWTLLLFLLAPQDAEIDRLVRQLGDNDPGLRDDAVKKLRELGAAPREALRRDHADAEVRVRAKELLVQIERDLEQQAREKEARPAKIKFFAADQKDLAPGVLVVDGARFTVKRRDWRSKGVVFETEVERFLEGDLEWDVAGIVAAGPLKVETCAVHSPGKVYVEGAPGAAKVTLKGLRRWYCDVPIEIKDPRDGERFRVGPFEIVLAWPNVSLKCDRKMPDAVLAKALSPADVRVTLRPGFSGGRFGGRRNLVARGGGGGDEERAWCGCIGKPSQDPKVPVALSDRRIVTPLSGASQALSDVASISITFHKPVEEAFEATSTPLK